MYVCMYKHQMVQHKILITSEVKYRNNVTNIETTLEIWEQCQKYENIVKIMGKCLNYGSNVKIMGILLKLWE